MCSFHLEDCWCTESNGLEGDDEVSTVSVVWGSHYVLVSDYWVLTSLKTVEPYTCYTACFPADSLHDDANFIFQHDPPAAHTAKSTSTLFSIHGITVFGWAATWIYRISSQGRREKPEPCKLDKAQYWWNLGKNSHNYLSKKKLELWLKVGACPAFRRLPFWVPALSSSVVVILGKTLLSPCLLVMARGPMGASVQQLRFCHCAPWQLQCECASEWRVKCFGVLSNRYSAM